MVAFVTFCDTDCTLVPRLEETDEGIEILEEGDVRRVLYDLGSRFPAPMAIIAACCKAFC